MENLTDFFDGDGDGDDGDNDSDDDSDGEDGLVLSSLRRGFSCWVSWMGPGEGGEESDAFSMLAINIKVLLTDAPPCEKMHLTNGKEYRRNITDELETKIIVNSTVGLLANYVNRRCDNFTFCWNASIPSCVEVLLARMLPTLGTRSVHTSSCAYSSIHTILYSRSMYIRKKYAKKETRGEIPLLLQPCRQKKNQSGGAVGSHKWEQFTTHCSWLD